MTRVPLPLSVKCHDLAVPLPAATGLCFNVLQLPPLFNPAPGNFSLKMLSHGMSGFAKCWHTHLDWN